MPAAEPLALRNSAMRARARACSSFHRPMSAGLMRPRASTPVASTNTRPAPPRAKRPRCTRCQSWATPSTALYWHMGETAIRLRRVRPLNVRGRSSKGWDMRGLQAESCLTDRRRPKAMVGREGIEPSTIRLKVECSTAELPAPVFAPERCGKARGPYADPLDRTSRKAHTAPKYRLVECSDHARAASDPFADPARRLGLRRSPGEGRARSGRAQARKTGPCFSSAAGHPVQREQLISALLAVQARVELFAEGLEAALRDRRPHRRHESLKEGQVVPGQQDLAEDLLALHQVVQIGL